MYNVPISSSYPVCYLFNISGVHFRALKAVIVSPLTPTRVCPTASTDLVLGTLADATGNFLHQLCLMLRQTRDAELERGQHGFVVSVTSGYRSGP